MKSDKEFTHGDLQEHAWWYGFAITKCRLCRRWWASKDDVMRLGHIVCINHVCNSKLFKHFYPWADRADKGLST